MNQNILRFISISVFGVFLMGACQSESPALVPLTGSNNKSTLPAQVTLAQENVLEYVLASRLESIPAQTDWQLQEVHKENEYHFRSGDWRMVIWTVEDDDQYQRVVLVNRVEELSWTGYMTSDGRVIDTSYGR